MVLLFEISISSNTVVAICIAVEFANELSKAKANEFAFASLFAIEVDSFNECACESEVESAKRHLANFRMIWKVQSLFVFGFKLNDFAF